MATNPTRTVRHPRSRRLASLRSHLLQAVLVSFLPLLVFSAAIIVLLASQQRATFQRGASDRIRALITAVDTELKRSIASLEALATSEHLHAGEFAAFYAEAKRVQESRSEWLSISLALPSGEQLMSLQRSFGDDLQPTGERPTLDEVVRTSQPVIGNLFKEHFSDEHVFAVRVPVGRPPIVDGVLSALVKPDAIRGLLSPQGLPEDWVGVVLDRNDVIVARTVSPDKMVGQLASPSLREALASTSEGWFQGRTLEGWEVYTPYHRSSFSGWTVATGIPAAEVEAPFYRSLAYLAAFGSSLLGLATLLAWLLSRKSTKSVEALARAADDLVLGRLPFPASGAMGSTGIAEVEELRTAFADAAQLIRDRSAERDRVVSSLREVEAALRKSDRQKDRFLALLGHELRNPLGILSTAVHLLKMSSDSEVEELREMMQRQITHMTRLIDDLLDVSRIVQGRIHLIQEPCDLVTVVRETTEDYRQEIERRGVRLEVDVPDRPLWLMGDPTRLEQAISNLLSNAGKFIEAGGTVAVRVSESASGEEAILSVRDTGVGMEPEFLDQVFEPFVQADHTIERSHGGLGLGLALVKGLVELHGGVVSAASDGPGKGSELTIRLPLQPATLRPVPTVPHRGEQPARPRRVLVVEDNRAAARSITMFLTEEGHTVEVAKSGPEGVEAAVRFHPEVVLCDIGLPGFDGYQLAQTLRREVGWTGYLIAATGYGQEGDRRRAREVGFDRHLTKPIDLEELRAILSSCGEHGGNSHPGS